MQYDILSIKFLFLLLPGLIGVKLKNYLLKRREPISNFIFMVESFVLGSLSYLIVFQFSKNNSKIYEFLDNNNLTSITSNIYGEVLFKIIISICVSIAISIFYSYIINSNCLFKILQHLNLTHEFYPDNVLDNLFLTHNKEVTNRWVEIKDLENNLIYHGYILEYKNNQESDSLELLLREVSVYISKYKIHIDKSQDSVEYPYIYLNLNRNSTTINFQQN